MTTFQQLSLPLSTFDDLTPFDRELLCAICAAVDPETGLARSLFDVAVRRRGLSYWYSLDRLGKLVALGYVEVRRAGPSRPLLLRPTS